MDALKKAIRERGRVLPGSIIKVDDFLNHQVDIALIKEMAAEFCKRFEGESITKVLTIEASGIAVAFPVADCLGVPLLFAKKGQAKNIGQDVYCADVHSYTRNSTYGVFVSKRYLSENDRVLILDDFLANGQASLGLISICRQAGAQVVGVGIAIEKRWQRGSELLREQGVKVESLAIITYMDEEKVEFED